MPVPTPHASTISIGLPSDEQLRAVVGNDHDGSNMLNVLKMMAGTEDMYAPSVGFIKAIFQANGIDPKIREVIMLRTAKVLNCPYEWQANVVLATNVGIGAGDIEALASDHAVTDLDPAYVLICAATDELSLGANVSDTTLSALLDTYGEVVTRKLILIIGWFNLLSRFLNGCRVPLETVNKIGQGTTPLSA